MLQIQLLLHQDISVTLHVISLAALDIPVRGGYVFDFSPMRRCICEFFDLSILAGRLQGEWPYTKTLSNPHVQNVHCLEPAVGGRLIIHMTCRMTNTYLPAFNMSASAGASILQ